MFWTGYWCFTFPHNYDSVLVMFSIPLYKVWSGNWICLWSKVHFKELSWCFCENMIERGVFHYRRVTCQSSVTILEWKPMNWRGMNRAPSGSGSVQRQTKSCFWDVKKSGEGKGQGRSRGLTKNVRIQVFTWNKWAEQVCSDCLILMPNIHICCPHGFSCH